MSKLTQARAGVPRAKPGAFVAPLSGRFDVVHDATKVFIEHGAQAASKRLGGGLRAEILMPRVFARAKYLARGAKRLAEAA